MRRFLLLLALLLLPLGFARPVVAEDPQPAAEAKPPLPKLVSDEEAKEAFVVFKQAWKAKGYKGDVKTAARERAMRRLAKVQHPDVAERLFKLTTSRDEDIRTLAVMYLGWQRAMPGLAGAYILKAVDKQSSDAVFVMFAVDAIKELSYRAQVPLFRKLLRHKDDTVRKVVILTIGDMKDMRMLEDILKLAKELKIDTGWKEDGHEVRYDSGAEGDHDQKMAEKKYRDKYGGKGRKARSAGRAMRDLRPILLEALKRLTGQEFYGREDAEKWAKDNAKDIEAKKKALDAEALAQVKQADELK